MREILFRGKRLDNGEWVEGAFVAKNDPLLGTYYAFIISQAPKDSFVTWYAVDPNTVGQYTDLTDKNGKKIFEGDIVRCSTGRICKILYFTSPGHCGFDLYPINGFDAPPPIKWKLFADIEVIGNIHDDRELLEVDNGI